MAKGDPRKGRVFERSRKYQRIHSRFQEAQRRVLLFFGGAVLLVIVLLIAGAIQGYVLTPRRAVAKVNNETITVADFQARVRFHRYLLVRQVLSYLTFYQQLAAMGIQPFQDQQLVQWVQLLDPQSKTDLGRQVLDTMIEDALIRQDLTARGITVSDAEVEEAIQRAFAYFPNGTPTPLPTSTPWATSTLSPTQLALLTPQVTPTPTEGPSPTPTSTPTATPAFTPTPEVPPTPQATPTATSSPTPYTYEAYQKDLQNVLKEMGISYPQLMRIFRDSLYRQKLLDELDAQVPHEEEQVWVRHILVPDKETADEVLLKLHNGEDWFLLAQQYSQDLFTKDSGGDLGWIAHGDTVSAFEEVAFVLDVGDVSGPVQTEYGWHIIQVLGKEKRPLSEQQRALRLQEAFQTWIATKRAEADIQIYEDVWPKYVPETPALPPQVQRLFVQPTPVLIPVTPVPVTPNPTP